MEALVTMLLVSILSAVYYKVFAVVINIFNFDSGSSLAISLAIVALVFNFALSLSLAVYSTYKIKAVM